MAWTILKRLLIAAVLLVALIAIGRTVVFYSTYIWLANEIETLGGVDISVARPLAIATISLLGLVPWWTLVVPWFSRGRRRIAFAGIGLLGAAVMALVQFATHDVNFTPVGPPRKFYILTPEGCKFSTTAGVDPQYGIPRLPLTPEIYRECSLWNQHATDIQKQTESANFDLRTGQAVRFFVPGTCVAYRVPGYDPQTGKKLVQATPDLIAHCEDQLAVAEQQRRDKERERRAVEEKRHAEETKRQQLDDEKRRRAADLDAKERERQATRLRLGHLMEIGRYVSFGQHASAAVDRYRFELREVDIFPDSVRFHLSIANPIPTVGREFGDKDVNQQSHANFEFALMYEDGTVRRSNQVRRQEGDIMDTDHGISLPQPGDEGSFVVDFPRTGASSIGFTLAINQQAVFRPRSYRFTFTKF